MQSILNFVRYNFQLNIDNPKFMSGNVKTKRVEITKHWSH